MHVCCLYKQRYQTSFAYHRRQIRYKRPFLDWLESSFLPVKITFEYATNTVRMNDTIYFEVGRKK
jgi:hypothetical protein